MRYQLDETFYSLQGEGHRAGTAAVFLRFAGCNLSCSFCDQRTAPRESYCPETLVRRVRELWPGPGAPCVILTGGEPLLQTDDILLNLFRYECFYVAVETNGTVPLRGPVTWVTLSPKKGHHPLLGYADEVKYVMSAGEPLPSCGVRAPWKFLSPVHKGAEVDKDALAWCVELCLKNPTWRLSTQAHKYWGVR